MPAREVFTRCQERGIEIQTDGENLLCTPRDLLTDDLREALRSHKHDIIALLRSRLADCPLWKAGLLCHAHTEGRCGYDPTACNVARGMRGYIEEHLTRKDEHEAS